MLTEHVIEPMTADDWPEVRRIYEQGGAAAFGAVQNAAGVQAVTISGSDTDAVFDPASATLYVAKGDALVALKAGTTSLSSGQRLALERPLGQLLAGRM